MDANTLYLRPASLSDAAALRAIYAPYVEKTAITFECTVPDVEAFAARMRATLRRYPYLVAVRGGEIVGYAYAGAFGARAAYAWAAEVSIYLREDQRRQGIGRRLYAALEALLRAQHVQTLYACIAYPDGADDVHLTKNSAQFHAHIGYRLVGVRHMVFRGLDGKAHRRVRSRAAVRAPVSGACAGGGAQYSARGVTENQPVSGFGNGLVIYRFCSSSYAPSSICAASARVMGAAVSAPSGNTPHDVRLDTAAHAHSGI